MAKIKPLFYRIIINNFLRKIFPFNPLWPNVLFLSLPENVRTPSVFSCFHWVGKDMENRAKMG